MLRAGKAATPNRVRGIHTSDKYEHVTNFSSTLDEEALKKTLLPVDVYHCYNFLAAQIHLQQLMY